MGRNFLFRYSQLFIFHAKSDITINHRIGSSDISYGNPFSRDLNHIKKKQKISQCRENRTEIFDFLSNFERLKRASRLVYA